MPSPLYKERICEMFDSFCTKTSSNYSIDLDRASKSKGKHYSEEPIDYLLELLGHKEQYPSDFFVLYADEYPCMVESEKLYKALLSLPEKQRKVLLFGFWKEMKDGEIAERMEVTTRTIYNLKQRAFKAIKKFYGEKALY